MTVQLPTPCHILDLNRLMANLEKIDRLKQLSDCRCLLAVKGFSAPSAFPLLRRVLDGISASGLFEARLGREAFGKYVQTVSPAFTPQTFPEIARLSDSVVFNSLRQLQAFQAAAREAGCKCGLRINPECSVNLKPSVDPCRKNSRLGVRRQELEQALFDRIDGLHLHTMCEQQADVLEYTVSYLLTHYDEYLRRVRWLNLGGGQLFGHEEYDIERAALCLNRLHRLYDLELFLEPCEGIFTDSGYFITTIIDIVDNEIPTAILDSSAVCHFPDAPFRGWERAVVGADGDNCHLPYFLAGPTCYAGDLFGMYKFSEPLQIGDQLIFRDTAAYSMVKNNLFNGVPPPALAFYSREDGVQLIREYGYETYLSMQ